MEVMRRLHEVFAERGAATTIVNCTIGLGYTAVATSDGGVGLSYTSFDRKTCCSFARDGVEVEGSPAKVLLDRLLSDDGIERSAGMATLNALNRARAAEMADDPAPGAVIRDLGAGRGTHVAMVGFFPPLARALEERGAELEVIDDSRGMGDPVRFEERLSSWAEVVVMSATALLNGTADGLLARMGPGARAIVLGPTTPMVPEVFVGTPVAVLAGMVPVDASRVLQLVRHGAGTPELQHHARKVCCAVT